MTVPVRSVEDTVLLECADLVKSCTVVGHYKPALVLFVEPQAGVKASEPSEVTAIKEEILNRIATFNASRFAHERIKNTEHIIVVPTGSLDRGGVRCYSA